MFWSFWGSITSFSGLFHSCFRVVQKLFGHCFRPERTYFWLYFWLKGLIYTQKFAFKAKNHAQTTSEQLQNNFEKGQKITFLLPKLPKNRCQFGPKRSLFSWNSKLNQKLVKNVAQTKNCIKSTKCSLKVKLFRLYRFLTGGSAWTTSEQLS